MLATGSQPSSLAANGEIQFHWWKPMEGWYELTTRLKIM